VAIAAIIEPSAEMASDDHAGQEVALVSQQSATNDLGANLVAVFLAERRATLLAKKLIARPFV
jgi:hypothetical protein